MKKLLAKAENKQKGIVSTLNQEDSLVIQTLTIKNERVFFIGGKMDLMQKEIFNSHDNAIKDFKLEPICLD